jgi:S1-C subfamily serine protease
VAGLTPGSLLFTVGGTFLGLVSADAGSPTLIPARLVLERGDLLARGRQFHGGDAGILVQDVDTPALRAAAGGQDGALVTSVVPDASRSAPAVGPGDLITHVDGERITGRAAFVYALARREADAAVTLTVLRAGQTRKVPVLLRSPYPAARPDAAATGSPPSGAARAPRGLGLAVRQRGAELEISQVDAMGSGHDAGLHAGDRITWIDGVDNLSRAALDDAFRQLGPGDTLLLRIRPAGAASQPRYERLVALTRS